MIAQATTTIVVAPIKMNREMRAKNERATKRMVESIAGSDGHCRLETAIICRYCARENVLLSRTRESYHNQRCLRFVLRHVKRLIKRVILQK